MSDTDENAVAWADVKPGVWLAVDGGDPLQVVEWQTPAISSDGHWSTTDPNTGIWEVAVIEGRWKVVPEPTKLWPCPWCGGKAEARSDREGTVVQCGACLEYRWSTDRQEAIQKWNTRAAPMPINIVFDGPPGPEGPRFIEVETDDGKGISVGAMQIAAWYKRTDGLWALRITELPKRTEDTP